MPDQIRCPKCSSTQITANKKGFSGGKAVAGAVLTGGVGLLAGTIGSNKVLITCLNCGNQFKPGAVKQTVNPTPNLIWDDVQKKHISNPESIKSSSMVWMVGVVGIVILLLLVRGCFYLINTSDTNSTPPIENKPPIAASITVIPKHSANLKYTVIKKDTNTIGEILGLYIYVKNIRSIKNINDELKNNYLSKAANDFQIYYFDNKYYAENYGDILFHGNDNDAEKASKHVIAKYEYSPNANVDQLYTGANSDDN